MDSIAITILRTAAATAVAAKYLSRPESSRITIIGCGAQARAQLIALRTVRSPSQVLVYDIDAETSSAFARDTSAALDLDIGVASDLRTATHASDIIVTCTPSRRAFLGVGHVDPGAFVAAVGADNEEKQEIDTALLSSSAVVVDSLAQCVAIGDLHHAIVAGAMSATDVRAELGEVIVDPRRGRARPEEIVIFDSTGVAIEDVAAATIVHERAMVEGVGLRVVLAGA